MLDIFKYLYERHGKTIGIILIILVILECVRRYYDIAFLRSGYKVNKEELKEYEQK